MKSFYTFRKALIIDSQTRKIELPYNICYALRQLNQLYKLNRFSEIYMDAYDHNIEIYCFLKRYDSKFIKYLFVKYITDVRDGIMLMD